ncbi:MAG TPA: hypothetical protein VMD91_15720 [Candidatus Sulfotelmatobacter sp.]|nr:hypothetical protein [Candidatus Sulfotelmatobacter sp.]
MKRLLAAGTLFALAACSGRGGSTVPATPATTPGAPSAPSGATRATLTIAVPRAGASSAANRRAPRYVSPSSANLVVAVNGGTASTYGLTPQSPGCVTQAAQLQCTFQVVAPAGSDTFSLQLTDGAGNVLSRNVVRATIASGVATPIGLTLAAATASVVIVPGAAATVDGTKPPYHVPGLFAQPVEVEALDVDGNVIIGPGAPSVTTVSMSTGGSYAGVASAQNSDPFAYVLRASGGSAGGQTVAISATVQDATLGDGTTPAPVSGTTAYTFTPAMVIAAGTLITAVSLESLKTVAQFPVCACEGLTIANSIAAASDGTIYAVHASFLGLGESFAVSVFSPGAESAGRSITTGVGGALALAVDKNDDLWVLTGGGFRQPPPSIAEFAPNASTASFTISGGSAQLSEPAGIAVDASGDVYESDSAGYVNVYPAGTKTPGTQLSDPSLAQPGPIALDASGGLYVNDEANQDIAYFAAGSTALTTTLFDSSFYNSGGSMPLVVDGGGNLWASLSSIPEIEQLAASSLPSAVTIDAYINAVSGPMAIVP